MSSTNSSINLISLAKLQIQYCIDKGYPLFAPEDGICFSCNQDIYSKLSEEEASTKHITGCPFCNTSYCE